MKHINKLLLTATASVVLLSCAKEYDSGYKPVKPDEVISNERLNSYDVLSKYVNHSTSPNFKLGTSVAASEFLKKETVYSLIRTNFEEMVADNTMMHGSVVKDDGSMDFSPVTNFINLAKDAGLSVFGNALCWHTNQNATYLNSLIDSVVFKTPLFPNKLNKTGLSDGTFSGWEFTSGAAVSVADYMGLSAIELTSGENSSNPEDLRLTTPDIPVVAGHENEVTMYILSESVGEGRISFEGLNDNTPALDWTGSGKSSATFATKVGWTKIQFRINNFAGSSIKLHIDLGYKPNVTYFINIAGLSVIDLNSSVDNPDEIFIESESGTVGSGWGVVDASDASGGKYTVAQNSPSVISDPAGADPQNYITYNFNVKTPGTYRLWTRTIPTVNNGGDDSFFVNINGGGFVFNWWALGSTVWQWNKLDAYDLSVGANTFSICAREDGMKIDKFYFTLTSNIPTGFGSSALAQEEITLKMTNEDKATVIRAALKNWISSIVTTCRDNVTAWDVVKEPMDNANPQELNTGKYKVLTSNEFYWQDYLGAAYAVDAFNFARENINDGGLLFISDYSLESNLVKCRGLIDYIAYIESMGATVDGISTQMHLTLSSDKEKIASMFKLLAATGKKIRISELMVSLSTTDPTLEMLQQQSDLYKSVITMYYTNVPASQQYGISLMGAQDTGSNKYGLWNTNFDRKPAYAEFADGLSGN
jgi:GH35 family endo-1,4-beta-xylanase